MTLHFTTKFSRYAVTKLLRFAVWMNLLGQVILQPDLFNDVQLPFQIVDVMFFIKQNLFE